EPKKWYVLRRLLMINRVKLEPFPPAANGLSKAELMVTVVAEIIAELLKADREGATVDLNRLKCDLASKYGLDSQPRLVDIIAAVPHEYKSILLPKLRAKPVRTASGIAVV